MVYFKNTYIIQYNYKNMCVVTSNYEISIKYAMCIKILISFFHSKDVENHEQGGLIVYLIGGR